jgi:hypothetical protein
MKRLLILGLVFAPFCLQGMEEPIPELPVHFQKLGEGRIEPIYVPVGSTLQYAV